MSLFDQPDLVRRFIDLGHSDITIYGEAYGGKLQRMSATYGPTLRFIAFDVKVGDIWVSVQNALDIANKLGIEFVPYEEIDATVAELDRVRDLPSEVAVRCGTSNPMPREGVVIRPLVELVKPNGERLIAKHKGDAFKETRVTREVGKELDIEAGESAALQWVTDMRLDHVLDRLGNPCEMSDTPRVLSAMLDDVFREGYGEISDTKQTRKAIGRRCMLLWKSRVQTIQV